MGLRMRLYPVNSILSDGVGLLPQCAVAQGEELLRRDIAIRLRAGILRPGDDAATDYPGETTIHIIEHGVLGAITIH